MRLNRVVTCITKHCFLSGILYVVSIQLLFAADSKLSRNLLHQQSLVIESTDLTAGDFFDSLMSKDLNERRLAEMYLVGVLDATENSAWCDYKSVKTITLDEFLFEEFKKLERQRYKERASIIISAFLEKRFACGRKK